MKSFVLGVTSSDDAEFLTHYSDARSSFAMRGACPSPGKMQYTLADEQDVRKPYV
jgi:hypothetical protein